MSTKHDFKVRQTSLGVCIAQGSHTVNNETIISDWSLETLFSVPSHTVREVDDEQWVSQWLGPISDFGGSFEAPKKQFSD